MPWLRQPILGYDGSNRACVTTLVAPNEEQRKNTTSCCRRETGIRRYHQERSAKSDLRRRANLCANYIDNIKAYTQKEKVRNRYTGQLEHPDERLMRSIEEKIDIPESRKDDFRREIMNYIGALAVEGKSFDYKTNERLHRALEIKLFEDQKDSIKLSTLVSNVVDRETQEKESTSSSSGSSRTTATTKSPPPTYAASWPTILHRGDTKGK